MSDHKIKSHSYCLHCTVRKHSTISSNSRLRLKTKINDFYDRSDCLLEYCRKCSVHFENSLWKMIITYDRYERNIAWRSLAKYIETSSWISTIRLYWEKIGIPTGIENNGTIDCKDIQSQSTGCCWRASYHLIVVLSILDLFKKQTKFELPSIRK